MSWIGGLCPRCGEPGTLRPGTDVLRCKPCKARIDRVNAQRQRDKKKRETYGQARKPYPRNRRKGSTPVTLEWMISNRGERDEQGCWIWLGYISEKGYGYISVEGRRRSVHILACELVGRFAPPDLEGDHRCRVRNCFNPDHIEYVTKKVNTQRGDVVKFIGGLCPKCGEPGTLRADGTARCRPCNARRERERRQRQRAEKT